MDKIKNVVKLWDISDAVEFSLLTGALSSEDIPYIVKEHGSGEYMRIIGGFSFMPTSIYVSKEDAKRAFDLVETIFSKNE